MDFYLKYKKTTRFLYKAPRGVWCGGFVETEPKSLGSDYSGEIIQTYIHKSTVTALVP